MPSGEELSSVEVIATGDPFVVRIPGDIGGSVAQQLMSLAQHPDNWHERVVLDIGAVTHLGADGVRAVEEMANRSLSLELRGASPAIMAELRAAGLEDRVLVVPGP